jgi:acyl-CoA thioesterase FadM
MVMVLRVAWMWLTYRSRGRLAVLGTGVLPMRVWPNDLDMNVHMNNGRYFSAADIGRIDWWLRTGLWNKAIMHGLRPMAGDANAKFSRALQAFERFEIRSRLLGWNEKWMFAEHRFVQADAIVATVVVRYLWHGKGRKHSPTEVLALIGFDEPSPPLPEWVLQWNASQDALTAGLRAGR